MVEGSSAKSEVADGGTRTATGSLYCVSTKNSVLFA